MARPERVLERAPWLLPVAWALTRGSSCDPVVLAEELGIPVRLAKSLAWHARRLGLCNTTIGILIIRSGREFAAETPAFLLYARLRNRRVSGMAISKTGAGGRPGEIAERVRKLLRG